MTERRLPLTPHELKGLLERLDEVMAEAVKLREAISHQLADQKRHQQQRLSTPRLSGGKARRSRPVT
jgi:hypothetical protein